MFNDIRIFLDDVQWKTQYEIKNGEIYYNTDLKYNWNIVDIIIDENVYENIVLLDNLPFDKINNSKIRINFKDMPNKILKFKVTINYKFFVKTVHKYINNFIDFDIFIEALKFFKSTEVGMDYSKDIDLLVNKLLIICNQDKKDIINLLLNNKVYKTFKSKMTDKDMMLLVTSYICVANPIIITQEEFNKMVIAAKESDNSEEDIWRLAMNYDSKGYDYSSLDEYFVNSKNIWYLGEYISSIWQIDLDKIIRLILATKDKEYIKNIIKDELINNHIDEKNMQKLKNYVDS